MQYSRIFPIAVTSSHEPHRLLLLFLRSVLLLRCATSIDMSEFLAAIGVPPLGVTLYKTRALPVQLSFRASVVPTTCINGVGVATMEQLVYWDGNFSETPQVVYGDGDDNGLLSVASILALNTVIGGDPRQEYYRCIKLAGTSHAGVVSDAAALKRVVDEILWSTPA